ncbi:MAG: DUF86 domain-containing protein [Mogibacterium sp.]|nr:DUF86 domain-containing protein [Mogibacterium sp.]
MFKGNRYYLQKMKDNADFILEHMQDISQEELEATPVLLDSMMLRLVQISEDARNISDAFKTLNKEIPWTDIYGLRNRIVHDYGNVDLGIIYDTLTNDIPKIKEFLEESLFSAE